MVRSPRIARLGVSYGGGRAPQWTLELLRYEILRLFGGRAAVDLGALRVGGTW